MKSIIRILSTIIGFFVLIINLGVTYDDFWKISGIDYSQTIDYKIYSSHSNGQLLWSRFTSCFLFWSLEILRRWWFNYILSVIFITIDIYNTFEWRQRIILLPVNYDYFLYTILYCFLFYLTIHSKY